MELQIFTLEQECFQSLQCISNFTAHMIHTNIQLALKFLLSQLPMSLNNVKQEIDSKLKVSPWCVK